MIIKLFKNQQPLVFIVLPIFILVVWVFSGLRYMTVISDNGMPLYSMLFLLVKGWPSFLLSLLGFVLIGTQCLHFNWIINKYEILNRATHLPALFYFIFSVFLPQFVSFHPVLFVNTLLLFIFERILRLYKNPMPLAIDFDIGLLISIASLFYFPALIFSILFFLSLAILKPFSWRDWVVGMMGIFIPFFFVFVIYYLSDNGSELLNIFKHTPMPDRIEIKNLLPDGYSVTIAVIVIVLIGTLLRLRSNFFKNDIKTRNYHQVVFFFLLISMGSALLTRENLLYKLNIICIPLSILVSNYFLYIKKNWWGELLFMILLSTLIFNYVISY